MGRIPDTSEVRDTDPVESIPEFALTTPVERPDMVKEAMVVVAKVEVPVTLKAPLTAVEARLVLPVTERVPPTEVFPESVEVAVTLRVLVLVVLAVTRGVDTWVVASMVGAVRVPVRLSPAKVGVEVVVRDWFKAIVPSTESVPPSPTREILFTETFPPVTVRVLLVVPPDTVKPSVWEVRVNPLTVVKLGVADTPMVEVPVTEIFDPAVRRDDISL
jgi:hypothetical protein